MAVAGVALVAGCGLDPGTPVFAPVPSHTSAGVRKKPDAGPTVCVKPGDGLAPSGGNTRPRVDLDPTGATVLWLPGLNSRPCRTVLTHIGAVRARRLAAEVDRAKPFPRGPIECPADDGSAATVFLTYARRAEAEVVRVGLTGCRSFSAPHRAILEGGGIGMLGRIPAGISTFD